MYTVTMPENNTKFKGVAAQFNAPYNPNSFYFDFSMSTPQVVMELSEHCVYLLTYITLGSNLTNEDFSASFNPANPLTLSLALVSNPSTIAQIALPDKSQIIYTDVFFCTEQKGDSLIATLSGSLLQVPDTVQLAAIPLNINLATMYNNDKAYYSAFKGTTGAFKAFKR